MISSGGQSNNSDDYGGVEFWSNPERTGWLTKQGEYIKTWRRRWFVLKQGKLFWFKDSDVTRVSRPRGVVPVASCLTAKGAEDVLNKQNAFELSTRDETMYFIADSEKEKEDWINSIGRSIVQNSRSVTDSELILLIPNFGLMGTCFVDWCVKFKNLCRNWLITANWFSSCDELV